MNHTGVLLIATRKYKSFVRPLIQQIDEKFLPTHEKTIFIFSDEPMQLESKSVIKTISIPSYKFPHATLLRYRIFSDSSFFLKECSHLAYLDVDMGIENEVGDGILGDGLTAVVHPGFYRGGGSWETRPESTSYVPTEKRKKYYAGGFQAGETITYLEAARTMARWIDEDERNGIMPIHHDESAWNKLLSEQENFIELDSGYCLVEEKNLREEWGIGHLTPYIIALSKNHEQIRS